MKIDEVDYRPEDYEKGWIERDEPYLPFLPYGLFFKHYHMIHKRRLYYKRVNRLDGLFLKICNLYNRVRIKYFE